MDQCATAMLVIAPPASLPLAVDFLGGRLTSDGGWSWIAEADATLGLTTTVAAVLPEWRRRRGRHTRLAMPRQRVYQIAAGYADQDDADALRTYPLLKLVCGRLPESDPDVAIQPTLSRFENSFSARDCNRLAEALGEVSLRERERAGVSTHIVLDCDSTDDPIHGEQEGSAYMATIGSGWYIRCSSSRGRPARSSRRFCGLVRPMRDMVPSAS